MNMKNFRIISYQIMDAVKDIQDDDFKGFDYPNNYTNSKTYNFSDGSVVVTYNEEVNELEIQIFEGHYKVRNSVDALIDIGIPIDRISSEKDLIEAIDEELDLIIAHYIMMKDELK